MILTPLNAKRGVPELIKKPPLNRNAVTVLSLPNASTQCPTSQAERVEYLNWHSTQLRNAHTELPYPTILLSNFVFRPGYFIALERKVRNAWLRIQRHYPVQYTAPSIWHPYSAPLPRTFPKPVPVACTESRWERLIQVLGGRTRYGRWIRL